MSNVNSFILQKFSLEQTLSNLIMVSVLLWQTFVIGITSAILVSGDACGNPPVPQYFRNENYFGLWYEIGKIQTSGGAFFEKDCVCTTIDVKGDPKSSNGEASAINSCRKISPNGKFLNATGALVDEAEPGHWKESFFPLAPKADYRIIYLDDNMAIEYDCSSMFGFFTNYCIHILSRTPTVNDTTVNKLVQFAESLGLNTQNLPYQKTLQAGCW